MLISRPDSLSSCPSQCQIDSNSLSLTAHQEAGVGQTEPRYQPIIRSDVSVFFHHRLFGFCLCWNAKYAPSLVIRLFKTIIAQ